VHIAVRHEQRKPFSSSSVFSFLQFWLGNLFERLAVFEVGPNVFRLIVASPKLAAFLVTLDGLRHGQFVALFSLPRSLDALALSGPLSGPLVSPVTPALASSASAPGPADPLAQPRPGLPPPAIPSQRRQHPCPNPPNTALLPPKKSRRPPLCLSLDSAGLLPAPPGPMPWPVPYICGRPRDPPPSSSPPRPTPSPSSRPPPASLPLSGELPRSSNPSSLSSLGARAAMDGPPSTVLLSGGILLL
jgi:hypothetical protein